MKTLEKTYEIKIPVYVSERILQEKQSLFSNTPETLLQHVQDILANYNSKPNSIVYTEKRNKTNRIGIKSVSPIEVSFGTDKGLILRVTAYKTNLLDGYYQDKTDTQKIDFQQLDKLCSDNYFYLLYPLVRRIYASNEDEVYWQLFVYEDPSKADDEMVQIGLVSFLFLIYKCTNIASHRQVHLLRRLLNLTI